MDDPQLTELILKFNNAIPDDKWNVVRPAIASTIVDQMDFDTLLKIAEMSLNEYYIEHQEELIVDLINYTSVDIAVQLLDSLKLDQPKYTSQEDYDRG
jgi:hypothetical protein